VLALTADLGESTRVLWFAKKFPERFFEVGVAEQNLIGISAGLAHEGFIPFASSFAVFSPGRSWEQIRVSVCYSKNNVKIIASHAGINVGADGATHQGLEDMAIMRCLPNMTVIAPADYLETKKAAMAAAEFNGPVYIRFGRAKTPAFTTQKTPFKIGQAEIVKSGKDVTIVACGPMVYQSLLAAKELAKQKIDVEVINNHTIKPLDKKTLLASVKKTKALVTAEDHQIAGGMSSAVIEMLAPNYPVPAEMIGIKDTFGESGTAEELYDKYGLSITHIIRAVEKVFSIK